MSYLDDFAARVNANGITIGESQFNSTELFIKSTFSDSPFYKVAKVNGQDLEIRLVDITAITRGNTIETLQFSMKYMMLLPNTTVNIGEIVQIDTQFWIVTDFISDNPLFPKAKITMCNYIVQIKTGETKVLKGTDSMGRPVYETQPVLSPVHAFVRSYMAGNTLNQPINSPSDRIYITVKYDDVSKVVKENDVLSLYSRDYKVIGIDFSNTIDFVGCISLMADREPITS